MKTMLKTLIASLAAFLMLVLAATSADAYRNVDSYSSWGRAAGKIWWNDSRHMGYQLNVYDKAADGRCVYVQFKGTRNNTYDGYWKRLTLDTCGSGNRNYRSGSKYVGSNLESYSGFKIRVCKNNPNAYDTCGQESAITRYGLAVYG